jgi:hypothetical protein
MLEIIVICMLVIGNVIIAFHIYIEATREIIMQQRINKGNNEVIGVANLQWLINPSNYLE